MTNIIKQFGTVPTTCISDALEGLHNMNPAIKPLQEQYKMTGRAFTVKMPEGDNLVVLKAINEAKHGDILVIDAQGNTNRAIAGDFILGLAQTLGIKGIVVDGVIRDIQGVKALNFPVFCKGTTVAASGKIGVGDVNIPISCGGISIQPGDIIVGDADGVVAIPQSIENKVLTKALDKLEKDQKREEKVSGNVAAIRKYLEDFLSR